MSEPVEFPFELEDFLATMTRVLMERGERNAIGVLAHGTTTARCDPFFDFGRYHYQWHLTTRLPPEVYGRLGAETRKSTEAVLQQVADEVFGKDDDDSNIEKFFITAAIVKDPAWKHTGLEFVRGHGEIHNQGRVRSDNPAMKMHDGLFFRSAAEVNFYKACKEANLVCAPLPVFLRPGGTRPYRIEPDMIILRNGHIIQVEINGSPFHEERAVDAQERTIAMQREGVEVFYIDADKCKTVEKAQTELHRLLQHFKLELPKTG